MLDEYGCPTVCPGRNHRRRTDSDETQDWVRRQNICTEAVLGRCELQPLIRKRFEEVYNYEKLSVPFKEGACVPRRCDLTGARVRLSGCATHTHSRPRCVSGLSAHRPVAAGDRFFVFKKTGLQNQSVLYMADSAEVRPLAPRPSPLDGGSCGAALRLVLTQTLPLVSRHVTSSWHVCVLTMHAC